MKAICIKEYTPNTIVGSIHEVLETHDTRGDFIYIKCPNGTMFYAPIANFQLLDEIRDNKIDLVLERDNKLNILLSEV